MYFNQQKRTRCIGLAIGLALGFEAIAADARVRLGNDEIRALGEQPNGGEFYPSKVRVSYHFRRWLVMMNTILPKSPNNPLKDLLRSITSVGSGKKLHLKLWSQLVKGLSLGVLLSLACCYLACYLDYKFNSMK